MKHKLFTLLIAVMANLGTMFAESGTCGDNLTWNLTGGVLTVSGTGAMEYFYPASAPWYSSRSYIRMIVINDGVTSIGEHAFQSCSSLTSVTIPNSVTSIGKDAFLNCSGLTSVMIPNSVTSIGYAAFRGCSSLTLIEIPNSVTSIGEYAFYECSGLTSAAIGSSVSSIGKYAFYNCSGLASVTIGNSVTSIGYAVFSGCSSLTSVTIPNSVKSIGEWAFSRCSGLTSVEIPSSVTSIGNSAFSDCSSLTFVTIPNSVTSIGEKAFNNCNSLTSLTIGNSVTSIGEKAFYQCSSLISITLNSNAIVRKNYSSLNIGYIFGSQVTEYIIGDSVTSIGYYAFQDCNSLTSVTIPSSVTSIGNSAFKGCSGLTSFTNYATTPQTINANVFTNVNKSTCTLYVPAESVEAYQAAYVWKEFGNILPIEDEPAPCLLASGTCGAQGDNLTWTLTCDSVLTISGTGAMADYSYSYSEQIPQAPWNSYLSEIKSVVIEEGATNIGRWAFGNCTSLTSVEIPNSVTSIGNYAFEGCSGLTSIEIPNSVTSIGNDAFYNCTSLTSVTIPNSVTSIGDGVLAGCNNLTSINVNAINANYSSLDGVLFNKDMTALIQYPGGKQGAYTIPNGVTVIRSSAFEGCSGLTSIEIPNSVTSIGEYAFLYCHGLTSVEIPNSVTSIGSGAFNNCTGLTSIEIPNSVTSIGNDAFFDCIGLTSIEIPNSVTSIGNSAFQYCSSLTSIEIPNSVTSIGKWAFSYCNSLTSITNQATTPQAINTNVFTNVNLSACTLYVPAESVSAYQAADVWKEFGNILPINSEPAAEHTYTVVGSSEVLFGSLWLETDVNNDMILEKGDDTFLWKKENVTLAAGNIEFKVCEDHSWTQSWPEYNYVLAIAESGVYTIQIYFNPATGIITADATKQDSCVIASGTCGAQGDNLTWTLTCDSVLTISGTGAMADYSGTDETPWNSYRDMIKILTLEEGVTTTGWNAFGLCTNMVTINIPSSLTYFHIFGFSDCISLRSINVAVDNQYYCSVDDVLFNKNKTILVKYPAAKSDVSYSIPNGVLELGMYSFEANTKLISVDIPNSVKSINNFAFLECSGLTSVTIPNSTTKIGRGAFYQCSSLTSIEIPYSVTTIDLMPFCGCSKLTSIDIAPENLNYCSVDGVLFDINKTTLIQYPIGNARTKYTIPNSVTNISESAFNACNNITSIEIPNSVTSLGSYSLYIHNLRYITNYATIPQSIENNVWGYVYKPNCTLYVPAESVAAYQAADVWKEFGNILAIDDSTEEVNYATLADIYNMAADSTFTLGAFDVMYVPDFQSGSNMYIKDSTGSCVIYKVNYGLQAGDHVEAGLQGKVSIYNGLHEVIPITAKEELTITHGEAPAPMVATEVPSLNNASQYVVYEGVSFTTDTAFVEGRRHTVYGSWNGQTITFYNQYYIGATLSANKTYNITAVNTIYQTTPEAYPLAVEEVDSVPDSCIIASGTCGAQGDNLAWTLSCDSVLTISGTGRMANYVLTNSKSPAPWYTYHTAIKSVVIEDGVTSIGKNAFSECDMALVMMSGSVSAIADYAFSSCKKIISVDVAIDNQNYCSVDGILFNKNKTTLILYPAAKSDTSYSIPESVTRIGTASFEYCDSLSNIHIPNSVISIGRSAFYGSSTLTYIAIPNSVTSIEEGAFIDCRGLTSVTIGNSVTSIVSSAFYNCSSLTTITNYAATPQTISSYVFTNVNISSCTLYVPAQSVAAYQAADVWKEFGNILPIEDTPETGKVVLLADVANYIDFQALSISEPKMVESTITSTNFYTLANGTKLVGFVNSDGSEVANSWVVDEGYYTNRPTPEWKGVDSLRVGTMFRAASGTTIELGAFSVSEASKLVVYFSPNGDIERGISVSIFGGEPVAFVRSGMKINGTRPAYAAEFDLPVGNYEESDVTIKIIRNTCNIFGVGIHNIEPEPCILASGTCGAEGDNLTWTLTCDSLLTISGTGAMEDYSSNSNWPWYSYRESITSIVVEDGVTRLGSFAFDYLVNVTSITLPNTVTQIGWYSIGNCYKLTSITIPASVTYISGSAFSYCEKLTAFNVDQNNSYYSSVDGVLFNKNQTQIIRYPIGKEGTHYTIPNTVVSIYDDAFASTKLESINMPNGIIEIGGWAFSDCMGLTSIVIPDQVSYIGTYAFSYCRNLESVTIPMSVTNIANGAFIACDNLKTVTNYSTIPQRVDSACFSYFGGGYYITTSTLYVPAQSVAAYQAADVWKEFGTILPIEGELPIEPTEGEFNVLYVGQDGDSISSEAVMLHLPVAPEIAGFTFLKWQVVAGDLENGIIIQAVYQAEEPTSAPAVYTNPANPAQKLIRNGNVYILTDDKIYSITGQTVR